MPDNPDEKARELENRVAELERMWSQLKWAAAILGTAVLIVAGVGFVQIPRMASDEAVKKVTPVAEDAAKKAAIEVVGARLPASVTAELNNQKVRAKEAADAAETAKKRVEKAEKEATEADQRIRKLEAALRGNFKEELANLKAAIDDLKKPRVREIVSKSDPTALTFTANNQSKEIPGLSLEVDVKRKTKLFIAFNVSGIDFISADQKAEPTREVFVRLSDAETPLAAAYVRFITNDRYDTRTVAQHWFGEVERGKHTFRVVCEAPAQKASDTVPLVLNVSHANATRSLMIFEIAP
ncbi:MAG: hypothetical protein L0Y71_19440 [Gemmataceae bacterium]|nr:hypothetical protein [Gemmataceae bacterium]